MEQGYELACSRCPVVLVVLHEPGDSFPQHRCNGGRPQEFDLALEMDEPPKTVGRIDEFWYMNRLR